MTAEEIGRLRPPALITEELRAAGLLRPLILLPDETEHDPDAELMTIRVNSISWHRIGQAPRVWLRGDIISDLAMDLGEMARPAIARQIAQEFIAARDGRA